MKIKKKVIIKEDLIEKEYIERQELNMIKKGMI